MAETTHVGPVQRQPGHKRYASEQADQDSATDAWIAAAVGATTLGELYDAASCAQSAGAWVERDAAWCRVLRDALGINDRAAMALLRRELGATLIDEVAS